jgi:hypothetical protein
LAEDYSLALKTSKRLTIWSALRLQMERRHSPLKAVAIR